MRLAVVFGLLALGGAGWGPLWGQEPDMPALVPGTKVIDASAPFLEARLAGQSVRLRFDLAAHAPVTLTPEAAARLGLAGDIRDGRKAKVRRGRLQVQVGRERVSIPWSSEALELDGRTGIVEVAVPARFRADGADGTIGPAAIPYEAVRLEQRPATAVDREMRWQLLSGNVFRGFYWQVQTGGQMVLVEVAPDLPFSVGTAATGAILAGVVGGKLSGPPRQVPVRYGVMRPARLLVLDAPWMGAGLPLSRLWMRTEDWEGRHRRPDEAETDPDEIRVFATRNPQRSNRFLTLGADVVGRCASIEWQRAGDVLVLACPAGRGP